MTNISVNNGRVSGNLETNDIDNPTRINAFADDYTLTEIVVGKDYFIGLNSEDFNVYLQLINGKTEEIIAEIDNYGSSSNAQLTFRPEEGIDYIARVTSFARNEVGNYELTANELISVDSELSLLIDVSTSVDSSEYELQISGYADVFDDASLYENVISQGLDGKVAVNFVLWSSSSRQQEVVGWTLIDSVEASQTFAQTLRETLLPEFGGSRPFNGRTSPSAAIDFADDLFFLNAFDGRRQAIEVSGDGKGSTLATETARDEALANGINVINGIFIGSPNSTDEDFYQNSLIGGINADGSPAFASNASSFEEFGNVVNDVLIRELTPSAFFFVSDADASLAEGDSDATQLTFTVNLSKASDQTTEVDFTTINGSAVEGSDFVATNGTLTFEPGETRQTVIVDVIDDQRLEVEETFSLVLSNAVNVDLREVPGIGTITDNDSLQLNNATIDENSPTDTVVGVL